MEFNLSAYLKEQKARVDEALERFLPQTSGLEARVVEAARYSLFAGGKRIRPILCIAAHDALKGNSPALYPVACALEMIHTYSLIHDDLPAMDNDDFRRGKPTNHKVFGEGVAILAGDLLLTYAFELIAGAATNGADASLLLEVIGLIAQAAGFRGMIGGQVIDLECENRSDVDLATIEYMHTKKTGALLTASVVSGALLGGAGDKDLERFRRYGHHFGLAFQITDDLLDLIGNFDQMGKSPGSDLQKNKKTYPALMGIEESRRAAEEHVNRAVEAIEVFGADAEPLRAIALYLLERRG
ncbi:polyprenyl synthetase family protein [Thermodesulforhabdus norvegica]|uniref:Farnesyl-diphosphate synthase n=1 Tax=Thermodesulforhabdus norvegica TaxID=39841 RepID=A0A1I4TA40_9BACT|nr:farnesyl diphosphate synthase [Thermodesulforhabdus norvegica]SFM73440.1 farnesyl-diphosphate synthase [Thermodesulforhabdus norvegica]